MFSWFEVCGLGEAVAALRAQAAPLRPHLPGWVLYALPDGCWSYSYAACALALHGDRGWTAWLWASLAAVAGLTAEFGQALGWVPGTYELQDLLAYAVGYGLACGSTTGKELS